ncbi:acyl-CoA dehydrogenase family protein [Parvibaculum sp.]|jgi:(2S)-methylsuccinyl-CoA dehydrogenase|uniref:acyl-CoA dehydrogenase family protein n=1 Tax=Parvibaculum sp. TaxID=2024848 RepID=UPI000C3C8DCC|nr:acyl-CoA dehydrogenase family protein [Parvibaculum sp.]MAM93120.1 acyl-CoA dehydrogenase [Parvibaculum sp.]|tara:strand:- start:16308 stop:18011 length:1704 start_codon:yes stop_codon:yes gene_type:complete
MSQSTAASSNPNAAEGKVLLDDLLPLTASAVEAAGTLLASAKAAVFAKVAKDGKVSAALVEKEQFAAHGLAWLATYVEALRQLNAYAARMEGEGRLGEFEALIVQVAFGEYLSQLAGGIPMSQGETVRLRDLGVSHEDAQTLFNDAARKLAAEGNTAAARARLAELIGANAGAATFGDAGLEDTYDQIRDQMRKFADAEVVPHAHEWHLKDDYIPLDVIAQMSELGVFGLTIPEAFGGLGLGKESMCVVSEELSRGYIGVGSLGTRSEIAAELILGGGTDEQKQKWLPKIASGETLPTAVFTEPNTGSDLASLKTRGKRDGDTYRVNGNKTWITHAARADVMTLLCRTNDEPGYRGLSILLAEKPRGDDNDPFPAKGMSGGEIEVLGYRGMKEFEIGFDDFEVKAENLLGTEEGQGFKQLMQTFESARIQTAARAVGVAQCALELGLRYAQERIQFGKPIMSFPRVFGKLVMMAVEIMVARQITYFAAREKDGGRRCDLEAGMAKLLAARVAWAAADNALQIHGGNGFALEYPVSRVLCDARILNIFEGAAEIQAQVIARRLLEGGN